jgi:hypothetical protein
MVTKSTRFDNSGFLSRNTNKSKPDDRDYQGSLTVAGVQYWLSGWVKENERGKFLKLAVKPKAAEQAKPDFDDEIEF